MREHRSNYDTLRATFVHSIIFDFTVKQIFERERGGERERMESSINLCDMHNSLRRKRGEGGEGG